MQIGCIPRARVLRTVVTTTRARLVPSATWSAARRGAEKVFICDECVALCAEIMAEEEGES